MLRAFAIGLSALAFGGMTGPSQAQPAPGPGANPMAAMMEHRAALTAQCPPPAPIPEADAAKLPIHVTRWGTKGPAVLIIHGGVQGNLGGGPKSFAKQEALAQGGWQLHVVDRPGFGASPTRGPDDMMRDAVWIADMFGDGVNLIGHSWGGAEALLAAARRPEAVRSLILIEPALEAILVGDPSLKDNPAMQAALAQRGKQLMGAQTPADYGLSFANSLGEVEPGSNSVSALLQKDASQAAKFGCTLLQARMAPPEAMRAAAAAVAKAGIPVLVITGGWSPAFDATGAVVAKLTGGKHVIVQSPNHFVQQASAAEFNEVADGFMREADKKPRPVAP